MEPTVPTTDLTRLEQLVNNLTSPSKYTTARVVGLYMDIETIQPQGVIRDHFENLLDMQLKAPSNYKDLDKIEKYIAEAKQKELERSSLHLSFAEIVCIGILQVEADGSEIYKSFARSPYEDEERIIREFVLYLQTLRDEGAIIQFYGKGIKRFDLPVIRVRMLKEGFPHDATQLHFIRYESNWVRDLEDDTFWPGSTWKEFVSLADIGMALGLADLVDLEYAGSDVQESYESGDVQTIEEHCEKDIRLIRAIFQKLGF